MISELAAGMSASSVETSRGLRHVLDLGAAEGSRQAQRTAGASDTGSVALSAAAAWR